MGHPGGGSGGKGQSLGGRRGQPKGGRLPSALQALGQGGKHLVPAMMSLVTALSSAIDPKTRPKGRPDNPSNGQSGGADSSSSGFVPVGFPSVSYKDGQPAWTLNDEG